MSESIFLKALRGKNDGRPPVWLMRQAGRYMPTYQQLRRQYALKELFCTPALASKVTLLPRHMLEVDAAILFADILVVLDMLGLSWDFQEGKGPIVQQVGCLADVAKLRVKEAHKAVGYVQEAIHLALPNLDVPLIGFCGGPFTIASYLVEGGSSRDLQKTKAWMYSKPEEFRRLLDIVAEATISYVKLQVDAGVSAIQVFDSWAGHLAPREFEEFALHYHIKLLQTLPPHIASILFCRGASTYYPALAAAKPTCVSLDWQVRLSQVRRQLPLPRALQGNLDPALLLATPSAIRERLDDLLEEMGGDPGFIVNLGHGVLPHTPFENVKFVVESVRNTTVRGKLDYGTARDASSQDEPAGSALY